MENKIIDLNNNVASLCDSYPELIDILKDLGFSKITNPITRKSIGRFMTIRNAAKMHNIDLDIIITKLEDNGFMIANENNNDRVQLLKEYLERLNKGEELAKVQEDFIKDFSHVDSFEIIQAEQELMNQGFEIKKIRKLCDIHSALFHHNLNDNESMLKEASLTKVYGHPLHILKLENEAILERLEKLNKAIHNDDIEDILTSLKKLRDINSHYKKKGELLYPLLAKYGINGPSEVMWDVDDQIRAEIKKLIKFFDQRDLKDSKNDIQALIIRMNEMIFKEEKILYPLCEDKFSKNDWYDLYRDFDDYSYSYLDEVPVWDEYENYQKQNIKENNTSTNNNEFSSNISFKFDKEGVIEFPSGKITLSQLDGLLKAMPMEITFIDHNNINKYFSEHCPIFPRPLSALERDVASCHPPKAQYMMNKVIEMFKSKEWRSFHRMDTKGNRCTLVRYYGVYDRNDKFMGVLELVEDFKKYYDDIHKTMKLLEEDQQ